MRTWRTMLAALAVGLMFGGSARAAALIYKLSGSGFYGAESIMIEDHVTGTSTTVVARSGYDLSVQGRFIVDLDKLPPNHPVESLYYANYFLPESTPTWMASEITASGLSFFGEFMTVSFATTGEVWSQLVGYYPGPYGSFMLDRLGRATAPPIETFDEAGRLLSRTWLDGVSDIWGGGTGSIMVGGLRFPDLASNGSGELPQLTATHGITTTYYDADGEPTRTDTAFRQLQGRVRISVISPTAVPEPQTWALMVSGVGLTGVVLRHRRRRFAPGPSATAQCQGW